MPFLKVTQKEDNKPYVTSTCKNYVVIIFSYSLLEFRSVQKSDVNIIPHRVGYNENTDTKRI